MSPSAPTTVAPTTAMSTSSTAAQLAAAAGAAAGASSIEVDSVSSAYAIAAHFRCILMMLMSSTVFDFCVFDCCRES